MGGKLIKNIIKNNSNGNKQAGGHIIEGNNNVYIDNRKGIFLESKNNILKFFLKMLLPDKKKKEMKEKYFYENVENDYEILFWELLENCKDQEIYNLYFQNKDKITSKAAIHYFYLAAINLSINNFKVENEILELAIIDFKNLPFNYLTYYNLGNAYLGLELYSKAIYYFEESLNVNNGKTFKAEALKNLGACYEKIGKKEIAYKYYLESFSLNPNLFEVLVSLCNYEITENNNYEKAIKYFDRVILEELPYERKCGFYSWKAFLNFGNNELDKSISCINSGLKLNENLEYLWEFGRVVFQDIQDIENINYPLKLSFFESYTKKYPTDENARALLGFDYYHLFSKGDPSYLEKSKSNLKKALNLGYKSNIPGLIHDHLGHLEEKDGNLDKAELYYSEAVLLNESNFSYCLGFFYQTQKKFPEAIKYLEKTLIEHSEDDLTWYNLGICYRNIGKIEKAIVCLKKAMELNTEYDLPVFVLSEIFYFKKKYEESLKYLNNFMKNHSNSRCYFNAEHLLSVVKIEITKKKIELLYKGLNEKL